jgi:hypothetical protein
MNYKEINKFLVKSQIIISWEVRKLKVVKLKQEIYKYEKNYL